MVESGTDGSMRCDAMRCDGRQGRQDGPVHMLTELKPALWGTSSMSHPLTGRSWQSWSRPALGLQLATMGPCQHDAPEAVLHGGGSSCSRCELHVSNVNYCYSIPRILRRLRTT